MNILYKLTFASGKSYIGQTIRSLKKRMAQHRQSVAHGSLLPVHCAWRSHGEPIIEVLAQFEKHEDLHKAEIDAIASFNTMSPNGYNISFGGETAPSKNPVVAAKIAAKATGRKIADTSRVSAGIRKNWQDPEYRQKVSDGLKATWDDARRKATSDRIKAMWAKRQAEGYVMPESAKQKLASYERTAETRAKMSESAKKRGAPVLDEAAQQRQSAGVAKSWQDPEVRAKRLASMQAARERRKQEKTSCR